MMGFSHPAGEVQVSEDRSVGVRLVLLCAVLALALVLGLTSCAARHPLMLCSQVAPNLMACMDYRDFKENGGGRGSETPDEPLQPKPSVGRDLTS